MKGWGRLTFFAGFPVFEKRWIANVDRKTPMMVADFRC